MNITRYDKEVNLRIAFLRNLKALLDSFDSNVVGDYIVLLRMLLFHWFMKYDVITLSGCRETKK